MTNVERMNVVHEIFERLSVIWARQAAAKRKLRYVRPIEWPKFYLLLQE